MVAVPVFGDTSGLQEVLGGIDDLDLDLVVVNDGNGPALTRGLAEAGRQCIEFELNRGVGAGTHEALRYARERGYPGVLAVDADGAHPLSAIAQVAFAAEQSPSCPILTTRFGSIGERYVPEAKRAANALAADLFLAATGHSRRDVACGLRYYPSSLAERRCRFERFGFVYDILNAVLYSGTRPEEIEVFVRYPASGPHVTRIDELCDLVDFCLSLRTIPPPLKTALERVSQLRSGGLFQTICLTLGSHDYAIDCIPSRGSCIISRSTLPTRTTSSPSPPSPARPAIGLIAEGGGRWARAHRVPLEASYSVSMKRIHDFVRVKKEELSGVVLYALSEYDLRRTSAEVGAALRAIQAGLEALRADECAPILYGDLHQLPESFRKAFVAANRCVCSRRRGAFPVVLCTAYSSRWERSIQSSAGSPWDIGLTPWALETIESLRLAAILRTGGARTLSDFLPSSSEYAVITLMEQCFNDVDVVRWYDPELAFLKTITHGAATTAVNDPPSEDSEHEHA